MLAQDSLFLLTAPSSFVTGTTCPLSAIVMSVVGAFCSSCFVCAVAGSLVGSGFLVLALLM
jgi:hypothetical protein